MSMNRYYRSYHRRRARSTSKQALYRKRNSERSTPNVFPILSLVEEMQDPVCYIDFSQNHFYSNQKLRDVCPLFLTQQFCSFDSLTSFFQDVIVQKDGDMEQFDLFWKEILKNRAATSPQMSPVELRMGSQTYQLIMNFTQTPRGVFFMWRDQTEAIRFEQQKNDFLAELSHELRSPLTAITGYVELLSYQQSDDDKASRMLQLVKQEASRLERLVDNFLDYQKVVYSNEQLVLEPFNLSDYLEELAEGYREVCPNHTLQLNLEGDIQIIGDKEKLTQMFYNLIGNAVKYSPAGGEIKIELTRCEDRCIFSICDSGIGIPEKSLPHIFDEYYRVDSDAHKKIKGTGLGLRICKRIAEAHGWVIQADSVYGIGTTFSVHILQPEPVA